MPAQPKPCKQPGCDLKKDAPSHFCYWHRLDRLLIDDQIAEAKQRRPKGVAKWGEAAVKPSSAWPAGRRWCSGCNFYVPLWYVQGSRCKACASEAAYSAHIMKSYGISYDTYLAIYQAQGGACYICRKKPRTKRLAVDHNHETNEVRGLLCTGTRSCNHDVLGNITSLDMAKRIVSYLEDPPARRVREGRELPLEDVAATGGVMAGRSRVNVDKGQQGGLYDLMLRQAADAIESRARRAKSGHYSDGDFWRFYEHPDGPYDIFHADPDKLDPKVWEKRLELAREREDLIAGQRERHAAQT